MLKCEAPASESHNVFNENTDSKTPPQTHSNKISDGGTQTCSFLTGVLTHTLFKNLCLPITTTKRGKVIYQQSTTQQQGQARIHPS